MASSQLSPKKYIETKARTLLIDKCLVTKVWKEAGEADVIVMRRHVNGNITAGFYLIDLMCLGVKDTFYFFNEPETEIYDRLPTDVETMFDEVDYALAHNIIYAGYDFALEYGIEPSKEFAVTKFILEEDNDDIPLIEIPVGDKDGLPHLIVDQPGEYSNALAKLVKNAGEGNYHYTISGISDDDVDEDGEFDEEGDYASEFMEDYELGDISPLNVQFIRNDDLYDSEKTDMRTPHENITIITERAIRNLRGEKPELFDFEEEEFDEYDLIDEATTIAYGIAEGDNEQFVEIMQTALLPENLEGIGEIQQEVFRNLLEKHADKLLVVVSIFENEFSINGKVLELAKSRIEDLQAYPLAKLDLALANLLVPEPEPGFEAIYEAEDISDLYPEADKLGKKELATFWLIKTVQNVNDGDLSEAIRFYYLYSEVNVLNFISMLVQVLLFDAIGKVLTNEDESDSEEQQY